MSSTRSKLIQLLSKSDHQYISGEQLSNELNITRSAIWKHMNELKKDGYEIEGKARKGYRIISYPNKLSENTVQWGLSTNWLGKKILHKEVIDSTQKLAHQLALDGEKHGTIVIADEQTSGKGRTGRPWQSNKSQGIWMSMILRPHILPYLAPQLTLLTATVLAHVLDDFANITPQIKWPNDILINGKKIAGILTEMQAEQDKVVYVIVGIGLNINQQVEDFEQQLAHKSTSLRMETDREWSLLPIIQRIIHVFEQKYESYIELGFRKVKNEWEKYGFKINERLQIKSGNKDWEGTFLGIAEDGALLAENANGNVEKIYSAEIAWF